MFFFSDLYSAVLDARTNTNVYANMPSTVALSGLVLNTGTTTIQEPSTGFFNFQFKVIFKFLKLCITKYGKSLCMH